MPKEYRVPGYCIGVLASLLLCACVSLDPTYKRPPAPIPATWPTGPAYAAAQSSAQAAADIPWQEFIKDENLRKVVDQALSNSRDLRKTLANVESARAQYRVQRASLLPHIDASVSATRSHTLNTGSGNSAVTVESDTAQFGLSSFEIDLFGKQRSLSRAAFETYLSTAEAARATRISLIAETTTSYLTLAADKSALTISQRTLENAQRSLDLTRRRLEAGVTSLVDVKQAETIYQQARADVASLTASIAQDRNALELLAGGRVDDTLLPAELPEAADWLADVPAGISSEVLLTRPDVLEAEHNLKSANANIGAARAAFFPSLTLTASGGRASDSLSTLFSGPNIWSVAPAVTLPIFAGGANTANLASAKAQRDAYVSAYELAIQTAFKEVADALAIRGTIQERLDAQAALVTASSDSYKLADARYSKGADTFLNALDSQRTLYSAEKALVSTQLTGLENVVTLYRVLGGGLAPNVDRTAAL
jgi:multidrug efflux system outer membrane protein